MTRFYIITLTIFAVVLNAPTASAQGNLLNTTGIAEVHSMSCQAIGTAIDQIDRQGNRVARFGRLATAVRNLSGDPYQVSGAEQTVGSVYGQMNSEKQRLYTMAAEARCGAGLSLQELLAYAEIDSGMSCPDIMARQLKVQEYQTDINELDVALRDLGLGNMGTSSANQQLANLQASINNAARSSGCAGLSGVPSSGSGVPIGGIVGKIGN